MPNSNQYVNPIALKHIGWKYYIVYDVWIVIELIVVYFFYIETRYTPLEEIAKHFDGEVSRVQKPQMFCTTLTFYRMLSLEATPLPRSPRSLPPRLVALTLLILARSARTLRPRSTRCYQYLSGLRPSETSSKSNGRMVAYKHLVITCNSKHWISITFVHRSTNLVIFLYVS